YPVAGASAVALLFAVYGFVRGEETAITTVPPQVATVAVFVPQTPTPMPPTPTAVPPPTSGPASEVPGAPVATVSWAQVGPIFAGRCALCHGAALASGGLALDTFGAALKGGQGGPVILPGNPGESVLMQMQSSGGHPGQLSAEELSILGAWIEAGAVEK
ncbi:MAG TPA: c-type cytochrome domain-containing protein, partial [Anaerolineales bacterium]|nr:c-type cytochrome domain-containing protein [Anaerolineales bacterium]